MLSLLYDLLYFIASLITSVVAYLGLFPIIILLNLIWYILSCRYFRKPPDGMHFMNPKDAFYLQGEIAENPCIVHAVIALKSKADTNLCRNAMFSKCVHGEKADGTSLYPRLKYRVKYLNGTPYWQELSDEEFNIEDHFYEDNNFEGTEEQLFDYVSNHYCDKMDINKPMWAFIVHQNVSNGKTYIILRYHHCIGDGLAFVGLLFSWVDNQVEMIQPKKVAIPRNFDSCLLTLKIIFSGVLSQLLFLMAKADSNLLHGPKLIGKRKCKISKIFSIEPLKAFRQLKNCKFNDVTQYLVNTALYRYAVKYRKNEHLESIYHSVTPMSTRDPRNIELNNSFALVYSEHSLNPDDTIRLEETISFLQEAKKSPTGMASLIAIELSHMLLPSFLTRAIFDFLAQKATNLISNVPGPATPVSVGGTDIEFISFWVPGRVNIGVGLSLFTYNNNLVFGVSGDEAVLPDPQRIIDEFSFAYREIEEQVKKV